MLDRQIADFALGQLELDEDAYRRAFDREAIRRDRSERGHGLTRDHRFQLTADQLDAHLQRRRFEFIAPREFFEIGLAQRDAGD